MALEMQEDVSFRIELIVSLQGKGQRTDQKENGGTSAVFNPGLTWHVGSIGLCFVKLNGRCPTEASIAIGCSQDFDEKLADAAAQVQEVASLGRSRLGFTRLVCA